MQSQIFNIKTRNASSEDMTSHEHMTLDVLKLMNPTQCIWPLLKVKICFDCVKT